MLLNLDIELIRAVNLNIALLLAQLFFSQVSNHFELNSKFHKVHSLSFSKILNDLSIEMFCRANILHSRNILCKDHSQL